MVSKTNVEQRFDLERGECWGSEDFDVLEALGYMCKLTHEVHSTDGIG